MRNLMGLRHVLGILVETRVDADVRQSPTEAADNAEVQRRRVDSHTAVLGGLIKFMTERGAEAAQVTADAAARKAAEGAARSAPVFFGGADNQEPTAEQTVSPPPCGYALTDKLIADLGPRLELQGVSVFRPEAGSPFVPLGQRSEPLIPLLLDKRGTRHVVEATAMDSCPAVPAPAAPSGPAVGPPVAPPAAQCLQPRTVTLRVPRPRGRVLRTVVTANGRKVRVRKGIALVRLRKRGSVVRVRFVQRVRRGGKVRVVRTVRVLRVCSVSAPR